MSSSSSSSRDEGKSGTIPEDDILQHAAAFFMSEEFQDAIDAFVARKCHLFSDQIASYAEADCYDPEADEYLEPGVTRLHRLEQHEAYAQFQELFESKLETFVERHGVSRAGFLRQCKQAVEDAEHGRETMGTVFVDLMLATSEYEGFVTMMATQAQELAPAPKK